MTRGGAYCDLEIRVRRPQHRGKSPNIVLDDADVAAAIAGSAQGIFFNQGEVCTAASRLYIHDSLFDEVVEGVSRAAEAIKVGHGMQPDTEMGPPARSSSTA